MIEGFIIHFLIILCLGIISALAFNLIAGYTGQLNLGFIALFSLGAYVSAILTVKVGLPIYMAIFFACLFTALVSLIIGLPTNKVKKEYFHLASLGFIFILGGLARNLISLTDGALGIKGIPRIINDNFYFLILILSVTLIVFLIFWLITSSHLGRIFQGIRDDELALQTLGYDTYKYKILAFIISGFFAGLSGALWAHYVTFIDPNIFNLSDAILLLAIIILGGLASIKGTIIGTVIIYLIPQLLKLIGLPDAIIGPLREMTFALILIIILIYKPKGIFGKVDL